MSVQAINSSMMNLSQIMPALTNDSEQSSSLNNDNESSPYSANNGVSNIALVSEQYSLTKSVMQFQNKDGDSVTLSTESIEYQKAMLTANGTNSQDDWKKVVDYMKQQYSSLKDEIMQSFYKSQGLDVQDNSTTGGTSQASSNDTIPGLPAYWNAENTSQRIVDFATSFLSAFKGSGQDFLTMIKNAIDQGFSEAKNVTGDQTDAVGNLVNNTHDLVDKKLDEWAQQQGITTDDSQQTDGQTVAQAA
jgi:Domain of unknown function (DUF5610)